MHKTTIIVVSNNNLSYLKECLNSIFKYTDNYEIIVVSNTLNNEKSKWLKEQENIDEIINDNIISAINLSLKKICNSDVLIVADGVSVTKNYLNNLKECLYSNEKIGAVSLIFNDDKKNNIVNKKLWQQQNHLNCDCILIKNDVISKIRLDDKYQNLNILSYDLSLKIASLGYKLYLMNDTSVNLNFKKYEDFNLNDLKYFKFKWHISQKDFGIKKDYSLPLVCNNMNVLEINSGLGNTLLYLKYYYNANITGVETNKYQRKITNSFFATYKSIDDIDLKFDYILIGNYLEYVKDPKKNIQKLANLLKDDGYIIGEINNALYIRNIKNIIEDEKYFDFMKPNNYSIKDIKELFKDFKEIKIIAWEKNSLELEDFILKNNLKSSEIKTIYYTFKYQKKSFIS